MKGAPHAALPASARLERGTLTPFRQGDLDGLCGLYATVNALRVLLQPVRPLRPREARRLFATGVEFLYDNDHLHDAVATGMGPKVGLELAKALANAAGEMAGHSVSVNQPLQQSARPSRTALFAAIEAAIIAGSPVLVALSGVHEHYTVIDGFSEHRLLLFDSGDLKLIRRVDCGPRHRGKDRRHRINTRSLTVFEQVSFSVSELDLGCFP